MSDFFSALLVGLAVAGLFAVALSSFLAVFEDGAA